jgi:hypothetical protein
MSETRTTVPLQSAVDGGGHIITTACDLVRAWTERDKQYEARALPLSPGEVCAIRAQRRHEAGFVEPRMRGPLTTKAAYWNPPATGMWS